MKVKSVWSGGLIYGGICGGVLGVVVATGSLSSGAGWQEAMYAAAGSAFMWGCIGFLLGFVSLHKPSAPTADVSIRSSTASIVKQWIYRLIAGLMLGFVGASTVQLIMLGFVVAFFGGLDGYLNRKHPPEEMRLHFLGAFAMTGSMTAAMVGGFLGVMIAPLRFKSRSIIRVSLLASALAALAGGWLGGCAAMLHPRTLTLEQAVVAALAAGAAAGIAFAIIVRLFASSEVNRTATPTIPDVATTSPMVTSITQHDL